MRKKIWVIAKYANIKKFGADSRQASLCKEFADAGHQVKMVVSNSSHLHKKLPRFSRRYFEMENDGYQVTWVDTIKYTHATSLMRIISWLWFEFFVMKLAFKKGVEKPDVVIASSLSLFSVLSGCFYKKIFKAKFIFEVRDIWPDSLVQLKNMSNKHPFIWLLRKVERLGYRYSDKIVGTMPGLHLHVEQEVGLGEKVEFIPQGVNLDFYKESQMVLENDFVSKYIPQNKFLVTYAGTLGSANAIEYIVDAAKLLQSNTDVCFLIVGEGYMKQKLIEQAKGLSNIIFAPAIKKEQVQALLSYSDLLVASVRDEAIYRYGISLNKFIDYMYAKKPIVCMFSGYPSMLNEAQCGEFTPSEDSITFVEAINKYKMFSGEKLNSIGTNGYSYLIKSRSFDILARKYMELF